MSCMSFLWQAGMILTLTCDCRTALGFLIYDVACYFNLRMEGFCKNVSTVVYFVVGEFT